MNIGFDAKRAFFNVTGLGNYSRYVIQSLSHYFSKHQYFLYTPPYQQNSKPNFNLQGANINIKFPLENFNKMCPALWRSFFLAKDLSKDKLDIYHGLSNELPYNIHKTKIKSLVTIHDLIFLRYPRLYPLLDRKIYKAKFKHSCKTADTIVAVSKQTKKDIVNYFKIPEEKVTVVYQGCDPAFLQPVTAERKSSIQKKYKLPDNYILYVGTIEERKNLLSVVKAIQYLKTKLNVALVVVGKGKNYKEKVLRYIYANKLEKHVMFLNNVIQDDLSAIYQNANLFIYPSVFEGFGIPVLEALYSKIPVITSNTSSLPEAGGPSSLYINPSNIEELAENIEKVLTDTLLHSKMIKDGYQYAQKFNQAATAKNLMLIYENLTR